MEAYRQLASRGESANAETLKLWDEKHRRHRGVHSSEITALLLEVGIVAPEKDEKVLKKLQQQSENEQWRKRLKQREEKRWGYLKRHQANRRTYNDLAKAKAKARKESWLSKKRSVDPGFKPWSKRIKLSK